MLISYKQAYPDSIRRSSTPAQAGTMRRGEFSSESESSVRTPSAVRFLGSQPITQAHVVYRLTRRFSSLGATPFSSLQSSALEDSITTPSSNSQPTSAGSSRINQTGWFVYSLILLHDELSLWYCDRSGILGTHDFINIHEGGLSECVSKAIREILLLLDTGQTHPPQRDWSWRPSTAPSVRSLI